MNKPLDVKIIQESILEIRGQKVLLGQDVALIYGVETKRINEAVKTNPEKFPEGYLIQISKDEWVGLKSKFSTSKWGGKVNPPTAFPEKGLCMLATILKSPQATGASFTINGSVLGLTKKEPERQAGGGRVPQAGPQGFAGRENREPNRRQDLRNHRLCRDSGIY
jgi:hypothetical protein